MSDEMKVEPALSAEEWADGAFNRDLRDTRETVTALDIDDMPWETPCYGQEAGRNGPVLTISDSEWGPRALPALIALANAMLPDSDPRKITRAKMAALESIIESAYERTQDHEPASRGFLAALASYLPPEGV